jgi:hypothetical protein
MNLLVGRVLSEHPVKLGAWVKAETYRLGYNDSQGRDSYISLWQSQWRKVSARTVLERGTVGGWTCWRLVGAIFS